MVFEQETWVYIVHDDKMADNYNVYTGEGREGEREREREYVWREGETRDGITCASCYCF